VTASHISKISISKFVFRRCLITRGNEKSYELHFEVVFKGNNKIVFEQLVVCIFMVQE
jgi:hypothetical protein